MISVYTDMGSTEKKTAIAYLVMDDSVYLDSDCIVIETNTRTSEMKELYAIHYALMKLQDIETNDEDVTLYTDSDGALLCIERTKSVRDRCVRSIRKMARELNVHFKSIKAHTKERTPNTIVDSMCTLKLKKECDSS